MTSRLIALAEKRGELRARIAMQRDALVQHSWPVAEMAGAADRIEEGVHWLKGHPAAVGAVVAAFVIVRPKRAWRLGKRGFYLWRTFRGLRERLEVVVEMAARRARSRWR